MRANRPQLVLPSRWAARDMARTQVWQQLEVEVMVLLAPVTSSLVVRVLLLVMISHRGTTWQAWQLINNSPTTPIVRLLPGKDQECTLL